MKEYFYKKEEEKLIDKILDIVTNKAALIYFKIKDKKYNKKLNKYKHIYK